MTVKDIVGKLSQSKNISRTKLAHRVGCRKVATLSESLSKNDGMNLDVWHLIKLVNAVGCQVIVRDRETSCEMILDGEPAGVPLVCENGSLDRRYVSIYAQLDAMGVKHKDFVQRVADTGVGAKPGYIDHHCRAMGREYGRTDVWMAIDSVMAELVKERGEDAC